MEDSFATGYAVGRGDGNSNYGYGGFGGEWAWIIIIFAMVFGWGRGGFGFGNGGGGGNLGYDLGSLATKSDLAAGFGNNAILSGINDLKLGQCQGFAGVDRGIADLGYRTQQCCCETNRNIDSVRYENAKNTCDIINANNAGIQRILDRMSANEIQSLRDTNLMQAVQLSQQAQSANLIQKLQPTPMPAYITCSPYQSVYGFPFGFNNNCGCNTGCGCSSVQ